MGRPTLFLVPPCINSLPCISLLSTLHQLSSLHLPLSPDSLGGNSMALLIGNLRQGSTPQQWSECSTTLQHMVNAKRSKNYPIINHGRARGLIQMIRRRMLAILEDRETLREQLNEVPADGDPNAMAISIARVGGTWVRRWSGALPLD